MRQHTRAPLDRRQFLGGVSAAGALAVIGLSGCGSRNNESRSGGSYSGEVAISHLTGTIDGAPLVIAQEMGYLADAGLDVELVGFPGGSETVRGITQSGMAFGLPSTVAAVTAFAKTSSPMRFVAGNNNRATVRFLVTDRSRLDSPRQLRGKKIAVSRPGSISTYFAEKMVRSAGLEPGRDVELLSVGGPPEAWTAATQGLVDAAWSAPPFSTTLVNKGQARELALVSDFVESWADSLLTTTQPVVDEQPRMLKNVVAVLNRAMTLIRDDPQAAAEAYAPTLGVDVEVTRQVLAEDPDGWSTAIPRAALPEIATAAKALQDTSGDIDFEALVDEQFLKRA